MKNFAKALKKTLLMTIGLLCIVTSVIICICLFYGIDISKISYKDIISGRFAQDTYTEQSADYVVADPVVVESVSYDRYAYQQLTDDQKTVYDQIYDCIINYDEKVSLSSSELEDLQAAYEAMMADYGGLFWVSGYKYNTYKSGDTILGLEFEPKYTMSQDQKDIYQATIDSVADDWLSGISEDASDFEKAKYVFETLVNNVEYDTGSIENQNILSVFVYKSTVCQGYADAAWYLLNELGIKTTIITGSANNESHAWDLVYLDGAYYYMDVTWGNSKYLDLDNSTSKRINYAYLAMTSEELSQTHTITDSFEVPECLSNADNYFVHEGLYYDSFNADVIGRHFSSSYNNGDSDISLKFANAELYQQVIQYFLTDQHISDYCSGLSSMYYILDDHANVITIQW